MFKQNKSPWQSKISSIFGNVKKVISLFTSVEVIKTGFEIVSHLMGIYCDEESGLFNDKMYSFVTENFCSEKEVNEVISKVVLVLIGQGYVERRVVECEEKENEKMRNKGNVLVKKAKDWYNVKKAAVLKSISGLNVENRLESKTRVDLLVMEDLASVFAYMALNKIETLGK